ncbi:MAG: hypothetical protein QOG91_258 [Candidatus Parcubacteria bacterium]|nr:hypothetical protein [Candidatus Parcubacteria bacterium]
MLGQIITIWDLRNNAGRMISLYRIELVYYLEVSLKERRYVFSTPRMW